MGGVKVTLGLQLTGLKKRVYDGLMDRLFVIDHSLKDAGGHHFDYVCSVADAARQVGRSVSIGCHRKLAKATSPESADLIESLQQLGNVRAVFRETVYQGDSWLAGLRQSKRAKTLAETRSESSKEKMIARWKGSLREMLARRRRKRIVKRFADGCRDFFRSQTPQSGDQVLVTAASELEVMGAVDFLMAHPAALRAKWHFLFHFNLFDGWTPEYESQRAAMVRTRRALLTAIRQLPVDSFRFHATTETLADQFNCLGAARFDPLPYPISSDFLGGVPSNTAKPIGRPKKDLKPAKPVTLVCAGATRREKGQATHLQDLVDQIKEPLLRTGKAKLLVQRPQQKRFGKRWLELNLGDQAGEGANDATSNDVLSKSALDQAIEYLAHPLPRDDYQQLLRSTDVGLFCYDARSYFSRCAGILVEMLACGKPVIVPAGTWLADQVQAPIQQHISNCQRQWNSQCKFEHSDFQFDRSNAPGPSGVWSFDQGSHPFAAAIDFESGHQVAIVSFDWHWPRQHGRYARVECVQRDAAGNLLTTFAQAVGVPRSNGSPKLLFRLSPKCRNLQFRLTNAFGYGAITIRNFALELYSDVALGAELPLGAVGVVAASPQELPQCVEEMVANIDHYQKTAEHFSYEWIDRHHPQLTVDRIFDRRGLSARVA